MTKEFKMESGAHMAIVRSFIQNHALNGSDVTWGSTDVLRFSHVCVYDLERLAQQIKDAAMRELELSERGRL